jgi:hypothetical protein
MRLLILALALLSLQAFAWGPTGHKTIALIAEKELSLEARNEIIKIFGKSNLEYASVWPDHVRNDWNWVHTKPYHFTNIRDNEDYWNSITSYQQGQTDAVMASLKAEQILLDPKSSLVEKRYALNFLVHLVGDLHQPLHSGRPEDRGGNLIILSWFGLDDNLHAVWDTGIIRAGLFNNHTRHASNHHIETPIQYLHSLAPISSQQKVSWQNGNIVDWTHESVQFRKASYHSATISEVMVLDQYKTLVDQRVQQGGIRLAYWLNKIFQKDAEFTKSIRMKLEQSKGKDYLKYVELVPKKSKTKMIKFQNDSFHSECSH